MTPPEMTRASTVLVLPVPDDRPPVLSADEAFCCPATGFVQDRLALDFDDASDEVFDRQHTGRADLPDPGPLVVVLARAFVEVMAGMRPAPQVSRWASPEVYAVLCRRSAVATRRGGISRRPAVVRRVQVQEPADGVVEACAVIVHHDRVRALAMRMTGLDRRWVVTELSVG